MQNFIKFSKEEYINNFIQIIRMKLLNELPETASELEMINKSYAILFKGTNHLKETLDDEYTSA